MVFWSSLLASLSLMSLVFMVSQKLKRLDVVDAAWGLAFIAVAVTSFFIGQQPLGLNTASLSVLLVAIWGLRLFSHILRRLSNHGEDPRYTQLKRSWNGNLALNAYLRIFLVQAVLAWVIALPIVIVNQAEPRPLDWLALVGGLVWLIGFALEAIGDQQLRTFVSDPKHRGKLLDSGLWRYSRHPNYFGELTQWWGIFIIALSTPMGWIGFIGPLTLTILILFISGIPLNEKRQTAKLGWQEYKRRTSSLVPLPPKK